MPASLDEGVRELLETLAARTDVVVGLVTGNLAPIAWAKMRALKIDRLFSRPPPSDAAAPPGAILGGYGSDHVDRGELVVLAARRAAAGTWNLEDYPGASDSAVELGVAFRAEKGETVVTQDGEPRSVFFVTSGTADAFVAVPELSASRPLLAARHILVGERDGDGRGD